MWIALEPESPDRAHTLDGEKFGNQPREFISLCGLALNGDGGIGIVDLPRCKPCNTRWSELNPQRRPAGHSKKLPRCICPTCGTEHINREEAKP